MKFLIKASSLARNTSTWDPHGGGQEKDVGESETVQHNKYNAFIHPKSGVQGSKTTETKTIEEEVRWKAGEERGTLTSLIIMVPSIASLRSVSVCLTALITRCMRSISCRKKIFIGERAPIFCSLALTCKTRMQLLDAQH